MIFLISIGNITCLIKTLRDLQSISRYLLSYGSLLYHGDEKTSTTLCWTQNSHLRTVTNCGLSVIHFEVTPLCIAHPKGFPPQKHRMVPHSTDVISVCLGLCTDDRQPCFPPSALAWIQEGNLLPTQALLLESRDLFGIKGWILNLPRGVFPSRFFIFPLFIITTMLFCHSNKV